MRILLVEDNRRLSNSLRMSLEEDGYAVDPAYDGQEGEELAEIYPYDAIILDIMLPIKDGLEVCRELRKKRINTPILMLTARDAVNDRVEGLDAGADDYMVKPFSLDELLARIRALLRRTQPARPKVYEFGDLILDTGSRQARRGNIVVDLTAKEYELLELFMRHPRQVLTREMIYDNVWGYDFGGESNIIEVYVRYLRQKLEPKGKSRLLHTVRGMGYVLRESE